MGKKVRKGTRRASGAPKDASAGPSGEARSRGGAAAGARTSSSQEKQPVRAGAKSTQPSGRSRTAANKAKGRARYKLDLGAPPSDRQAQRALGHVPVLLGSDGDLLSMDVHEVRPQGFALVPRRPAWSFEDDVDVLERREQTAFEKWKKDVGNDCYYERNLETWRQLWRVVERSDVLVLVVDIRFPALHFVPDLYNYVKESPEKQMLIALNKCDLVSNQVREAWCAYFRHEFPQLSIVNFSSFPDAKLAPCDANSEILSKRERRMAKSKLAAWGSDRLVEAVAKLPLSESKKHFLEEWRISVHAKDKPESATDANLALLTDAVNLTPGSSLRSFSPLSDGVIDNRDNPEPNKERPNKGKKGGRRKRPRGKPDVSAITEVKSRNEKDGNKAVQNMDLKKADSSSVVSMDEDRMMDNMITIGVVGHPNVGKSSMINGIFNRKVVSTSRTPGHTKHLQTMFLTPHVRLCDCPGLVFPAHAPRELQTLAGMFPISQVNEPYAVVKYLADRVNLPKLLDVCDDITRATLRDEKGTEEDEEWTAITICEAWAVKRGFRNAKSARLDTFRAANSILRMTLEGRIVLHTVPSGFVRSNMNVEADETCASGTLLDSAGTRNADDKYEWCSVEDEEDESTSSTKSDGDIGNTFSVLLQGTDHDDM